ncbi:Hypothetical protein NTJ_04770 [Nesidiocoris tenuis]|uniref:SWI/SNF-related matrix-associated actin-dependent regulator of chromatin subfamily A-like protein 1 n=1 Tax=Nesidiocoris tenuis TaxID=355587 RepID=A0ABN7AI67_9HEMI|nr:Hypothetical protein NTJ_04770 [Nesidiocoris tenuis]
MDNKKDHSSTITAEQKKRTEESLRLALEKRAARLARCQTACVPKTINSSPKPGPSNCDRDLGRVAFPQTSLKANGLKSVNHFEKGIANQKSKNPSLNVVSHLELEGTLSLVSPDRFVCYIGYDKSTIDVFKSIEGAEYNCINKDPRADRNYKPDRKWTFPLKQYENFREKTKQLAPRVKIGTLPQNVIKMFSNPDICLQDYKNVDITSIEPVLLRTLFPFQKEGVQFAISRNGRCLIADEMGLGKTVQALAVADYYHQDWPILIVCPSSMRFQWQEEVLKYLKKIPSYGIIVVTKGNTIIENPKVVIISYDLVHKLKEILKQLKFNFVICDECHSIKEKKSNRTQGVLEMTKKARRVLLLSGTPLLSRPKDMFPQLQAIAPSLFPDQRKYEVRYCDGKETKFGWNATGSSNLLELKTILQHKVMIRRLKVEVLDQLPQKTRMKLSLNRIGKICTDSAKMRNFEQIMTQDRLNKREQRSTLLTYYAETGKAKIPAICSYLKELLKQNKKFLVFAHHKEVLDAISNLLEETETHYIRIDGSVHSEDRKNVADQFQENEKFRVAVLSITAASTGLTLTAAQLVVFAELFWNPAQLLQAEDRAHRIGQQSTVMVQYLLADGTSDDHFWPLIQNKIDVLNQTGLSREKKLDVENEPPSKPSRITDFFSSIDDVDEVDSEAICDLMDQIDASYQSENNHEVPPKKIKLT